MTLRKPFGRRHQRTADHLRTCADCSVAVRRERQYLQRLREAPVPPASDDLAARLVARTGMLAAAPEFARSPRPGARAMALTAGGTAAAAGMLVLGAFALAGEDVPMAGTAMNGSLVQRTAQLPADGRELSGPQLSALRSGGWVCPGLEALGFHVQSAKAIVFNGRPAVEMRLSDGQHYAIVVEQHPAGTAQPGAALQNAGKLVVTGAAPWTATYETAAGSFTVESDLPADRADDAVPLLRRLSELAVEGVNAGTGTESAESQAAGPDNSPGARLERGMRKIGEMLTR